MNLKDKNIGFALTGSFCTFKRIVSEIEQLIDAGANVIPIMSESVYSTDTRFGDSGYFVSKIEEMTKNKIIKSVKEAEPIGPQAMLDLLIIAPCTGNSLGKLANGIFDTSVTLAAKAHLRNNRPLLIAVSTNDGLGGSAKNLGLLLNYKNIYFVPFKQDDFVNKPRSLVADMSQIKIAAEYALDNVQVQPLLC